MKKIKYSNACYSGSGLYLYHGEFTDRTFFLATDENDITIFDTLPSFDYSMEFFEAHKQGYIDEGTEENKDIFLSILNWIISNHPEGNYSTEEMENRKNKIEGRNSK